MANKSTPRHVGFIPDGNRRWAMDHGLPKEAGYAQGINPGLLLYEKCKECGIKEISIYGFTQDNTKRPSIQKQAFSEACVAFAFEIEQRGAALLIVGDETSKQFPKVLREFRQRQGVGIDSVPPIVEGSGGPELASAYAAAPARATADVAARFPVA